MSGLHLAPVLDPAGAWSAAAVPGAGLGAGLGDRVGLDGVLGDLRHRGRTARVRGVPDARAFGWDRHDARTREWMPQGLTCAADGGPPATHGRRVLLAAWYRRDGSASDTASRVSVVDLGDAGAPETERPPSYEHVLLVEAGRDPVARTTRHRQVPVHAGGLAWRGHLLLVADTRHGVRTFDLRDVVRVPADVPDTYACRYLLPQCGRLLAGSDDGVRPLRWSFVSLDRTDAAGPWLVAGEYSRSGTGARLARFPLPPDPVASSELLRAVEVVEAGIASMQGACRVRGTYLVSASHGRRHRGHLWVGDSSGFRQLAGALPVGPEDLCHDGHTGRLWTQTEHPGQRVVVSLPLPHR